MWNLVYQALHLIARVLTLLITGFIVYLSLKLIYNYFLHPLRSFPGPLLVSHYFQGFLSILQRTFGGISYQRVLEAVRLLRWICDHPFTLAVVSMIADPEHVSGASHHFPELRLLCAEQ